MCIRDSKDTNWPTLDPKDPYRLSIEEEDLIRKILHSFETVSYTHLDVYKRQIHRVEFSVLVSFSGAVYDVSDYR